MGKILIGDVEEQCWTEKHFGTQETESNRYNLMMNITELDVV